MAWLGMISLCPHPGRGGLGAARGLPREHFFLSRSIFLRGNNNIPLVAEDLIGRRTETVLTVICDREGPQLALEDID